jgi:hypothetical protein
LEVHHEQSVDFHNFAVCRDQDSSQAWLNLEQLFVHRKEGLSLPDLSIDVDNIIESINAGVCRLFGSVAYLV